MSGFSPRVDTDGLLEYSVVYSDRSLNHMSAQFQQVMNDISRLLKHVYNGHSVAIVPGGGTYAMEAVARQFASDKRCLILRNGWFSYRWSQIFEKGRITQSTEVLKARPENNKKGAPFAPAPIEEVVNAIRTDQPDLVFAPHVETSAGMILPDDYLQKVASATHEAGGLFVLDAIASGCVWVDMEELGVDVVISAPQKGWSSSPCAGLVMMSEAAQTKLMETESTSFANDLKQWYQIMQAYEKGGHAYHATMPTDSLKVFRDVMLEMQELGFHMAQEQQIILGTQVRSLLEDYGFASVAAQGYQAPSVVVSYTDDPKIHDGSKFKEAGVQIAKGVPLACDEPDNFQTFRIGLFGLDKLTHVQNTISQLKKALHSITNNVLSS